MQCEVGCNAAWQTWTGCTFQPGNSSGNAAQPFGWAASIAAWPTIWAHLAGLLGQRAHLACAESPCSRMISVSSLACSSDHAWSSESAALARCSRISQKPCGPDRSFLPPSIAFPSESPTALLHSSSCSCCAVEGSRTLVAACPHQRHRRQYGPVELRLSRLRLVPGAAGPWTCRRARAILTVR